MIEQIYFVAFGLNHNNYYQYLAAKLLKSKVYFWSERREWIGMEISYRESYLVSKKRQTHRISYWYCHDVLYRQVIQIKNKAITIYSTTIHGTKRISIILYSIINLWKMNCNCSCFDSKEYVIYLFCNFHFSIQPLL